MSSEALEDFVWKRLKAICVEDIGMGQPQAAPVIDSLDHFRKDFDYGAVSYTHLPEEAEVAIQELEAQING